MKLKVCSLLIGFLILFCATAVLSPAPAFARHIQYLGNEANVYIEPGQPTQILFPKKVAGGWKIKNSSLSIEKQAELLILYAKPELLNTGEVILVRLDDNTTYALRIRRAHAGNPRDEGITFSDHREPKAGIVEAVPAAMGTFATVSTVSGLMRELTLITEFGKKSSIPGYRYSNRYRGETILNDGALEAKIDAIFMGQELWGYVLNVTNLLDKPQRLNPAMFRIDGTKAFAATHWELAPRPVTAMQHALKRHVGKYYLVTNSPDRKAPKTIKSRAPAPSRNPISIGSKILLLGFLVGILLVCKILLLRRLQTRE